MELHVYTVGVREGGRGEMRYRPKEGGREGERKRGREWEGGGGMGGERGEGGRKKEKEKEKDWGDIEIERISDKGREGGKM